VKEEKAGYNALSGTVSVVSEKGQKNETSENCQENGGNKLEVIRRQLSPDADK